MGKIITFSSFICKKSELKLPVMKRILGFISALISALCIVTASMCEKNGAETVEFVVQFQVPENVTIPFGSASMDFRVMFSKAPLKTDVVVLGDPTGKYHECPITSVSNSSFTISLYEGMASGKYDVYIQRGNDRKKMGTMNVVISYQTDDTEEIELVQGNNVYGVVKCGSTGIKDVVVSDGYVVVKTDAKGVYQFKSKKEHKYVFISVPSGYEAMNEGVLPKMHQQLVKGAAESERVDFMLKEAGDQTNHTMLFFGDIHLANRTNDRNQFKVFTDEICDFVTANAGKKVYAMTLGDMVWELYWYSNKYAFEEYLIDANAMSGLTIFHTIGNHDHDMLFAGDFDTVTKYKKLIAPTYYSFNIGKVHYVVLDDIECMNTGAGDAASRNYADNVVNEQIEWLKKDLAYVPTSTPVVVTSHAPFYNDSNNGSLNNVSALESILSKYDDVHIFTGHTHKMYNVDKTSSKNIFEHNAGAVCTTWWWTGNYTTGIHVAQDGAPGGYSIVNVTNEDFKWQFKGTGRDINHQFRSYDRNSIVMTAENFVPSNKTAAQKAKFEEAAGDWVKASTDNYVYINVWNYDPSWTIEVKEGDVKLNVEKVTAKDPLHLIAYNGQSPDGGFGTSNTKHMFRVKASSATSTLNIKVTDRFQNVYTETMTRPKAFSLAAYK